MVFWEHEEHEVACSWLWAFKMWLGNAVLLAPGSQNVAPGSENGESPDSRGTGPASAQTPMGSHDFFLSPLETYQSSRL
eukprot:1113044-Pyramimonas_sp.AAC.1